STTTTLRNATVALNSATATGDIVVAEGGVLAGTTLTTKASILSGNQALTGRDCSATTTSQGFNLVQHPGGCLSSPKPSDVTGHGARLGLLSQNGGPTQTMAIPTTSLAFNAIPKIQCAVPLDQRGFTRPQGLRCDIGAFERLVA